jgi:hypothetical protein
MPDANDAGATKPAVADTQEQGSAAPTTPPAEIDLTSIPAFRKWQSEQDRKAAQREKAYQDEVSRLGAELAGIRQTLTQREEANLSALDPDEQIAELRRRLDDERARNAEAQQRRQEEERAKQQAETISTRVANMLSSAGLKWDDPRLKDALALGPTPDGAAAVAEAVATIAATEAAEAKKRISEAEEKARKKGRQEGIAQTGATDTSTASGTPPSEAEERAGKVKAFKERFTKLTGAGIDDPRIRRLQADMRREKVTFDDLGY